MQSSALAAWLRLSLAGLSAKHQRNFLPQCGDPALFFSQTEKTWRGHILRVFGDEEGTVILQKLDGVSEASINHSLQWASEQGNYLLPNTHALMGKSKSLHQEGVTEALTSYYPPKISALDDAPLMLYAKGDLSWLACPSLAIVGSRSASAYGERLAEDFAEDLAKAGLTVVSGLALGVDAFAHRGALKHNGATIAVLGTGANIIYPPKNRSLAKHIAEQGLILSEFPLDTPPRPHHFPRRNRLIAALSLGTLVIEASEKSGALITARMAAELGRDVFAIPGSVHSPMSRGPHRLLREGAKLVETTLDVLEELHTQLLSFVHTMPLTIEKERAESATSTPGSVKINETMVDKIMDKKAQQEKKISSSKPTKEDELNLDGVQKDLLQTIPYSPTLLDDIIKKAGLPLSQVHGLLLDLEMEGRVASLAGGRFQRLR